jgi:hypothetical protein
MVRKVPPALFLSPISWFTVTGYGWNLSMLHGTGIEHSIVKKETRGNRESGKFSSPLNLLIW